jgi:osmotically-inducible protein OsmY
MGGFVRNAAPRAGNDAETAIVCTEASSIQRGKNMNTRTKTLLMAGALIAAASAMSSQAADPSVASPTTVDAPPATADQLITTQVQDVLRNDPRLSGEIGVETHDGEVTLNGLVTTSGEADRAGRDAESVEGVRALHDDLKAYVGQH